MLPNDRLTVGAIGVLAMCLVTFDHEALGHGGACLWVGGHIVLLTSSIFHCNLQSIWVSPAGPACNLLAGCMALAVSRAVSRRNAPLGLFLLLVAAFSFYWEAGYTLRAMYTRGGDLYVAGRDAFGEPSAWWRCVAAGAALALYAGVTRWASSTLTFLWPDLEQARSVARTAWVAATLAAAAAALAYTGAGSGDLSDAVAEIGAASLPLPFLPKRPDSPERGGESIAILRSWPIIACTAILYALFVATLGVGVRASGVRSTTSLRCERVSSDAQNCAGDHRVAAA